MSLTKSATRRLSLLAGSSLVAATLSAFALTGAALAPTAALAANECTPVGTAPGDNGAIPDAYSCLAGTFANGITYSSNGALTVGMIANGATVNSTLTANGVNLTGNGTDAVTFNSSVGTLTGGAGTAGPVIEATSVSGAINITTNGVTGTTAGTTYGIYAKSTGGGAITIARSAGAVSNNVAGGNAAIWAETNGGAVNITTAAATTGRLRGILAQTSGTGVVNLTIGGAVSASAVDGLAGVETVAGTGATTITIASGAVSGGLGPAIRSTSASTSATAAVNVQNTGGTVNGRVDFSLVSAGAATFNNAGATTTTGRWTASGASVFTGFNDTLTMGGVGQNTAASGTSISFGAGNDTWTLGGQLVATGTTVDFGIGNDSFSVGGLLAATTTSMDFGAGTDTLAMSGTLAASGLTLTNLEAFNLSGVAYLGGVSGTATNLAVGDVLKMTSGTFTGSGSARVVMDVMPGLGAQEGCATVTLADCLDLRGASSAGVTLLTLNDVNTNAATQGGFNPTGITLVDVGGAGSSAAGHFVIDPNTPGYVADPVLGGTVERPGLFRYALQYDAANQRHNLVGLPRSETMEYVMVGGAAQSIWHMTADAVTNRQTDLRDGAEGGSVWMRATGQYSERTLETSLENLGDTFTFDNSYRLYAGSVTGGMDFVSGSAGGYDYVFGGQLGYVGSSFELEASPSTGRFSGATGGVYASLWSPQFFLDGTLNANVLTLDYSSPGLGVKTNTYLNSLGGKAEGGARVQLSERAFLEPLATVAYVRTSFEEISLAGGEIQPADATSLRGALGLRLGANMVGQAINASYYLTGRAWNEFEGDNTGVVHNPGADLAFGDDFSGGFGEAEFGVSLFNAANTVSGFLTSGVKFKDGYNTIDLAGGVRLAW